MSLLTCVIPFTGVHLKGGLAPRGVYLKVSLPRGDLPLEGLPLGGVCLREVFFQEEYVFRWVCIGVGE